MNDLERQQLSVIVSELNEALLPSYQIVFFVDAPFIKHKPSTFTWGLRMSNWESWSFDQVVSTLFANLVEVLQKEGQSLEAFEPF